MIRFRTALQSAAVLALLAAGASMGGCALIDEDAELDPRVMNPPDQGYEANYPRGHATNNPVF